MSATPTAPPGDEAARVWRGLWEEPWPESNWGSVLEHLARHAVPLRLATLLHDGGKPATRSVEPDGRTHFFGHAELGAAMAVDGLTRWRLPRALIERVALLVEQHLRPGQVASPGRPPTGKALHRFQRALGDATPDVCFLFLADSLATVGADALLPRWDAYVAHVRRIITWAPPAFESPGGPIVNGLDVIAATGLEPGPAVGQILEAIAEAAAAGELRTRDDALALAKTLADDSKRQASTD